MHPGEVFPLYRFGRTGPVLLRDRGFTVQRGLSERKEHDMCKHRRSRAYSYARYRSHGYDFDSAGSYGQSARSPADIKSETVNQLLAHDGYIRPLPPTMKSFSRIFQERLWDFMRSEEIYTYIRNARLAITACDFFWLPTLTATGARVSLRA